MCMKNVKWSVGWRYTSPFPDAMAYSQETQKCKLLINTTALDVNDLYMKTNPWTPVSKASFTLLTYLTFIIDLGLSRSTSSAIETYHFQKFSLKEAAWLTNCQHCKKCLDLSLLYKMQATEVIRVHGKFKLPKKDERQRETGR